MSKHPRIPQSWAGFHAEREERPKAGFSGFLTMLILAAIVGAGLGLFTYFMLASRAYIFVGESERIMIRFVIGGAALSAILCTVFWFGKDDWFAPKE